MQRHKRAATPAGRLLDSAVELIAEADGRDITIEGVAARAQVPATTATALFSSPSEIVAAICLHRIRDVAVSTDAARGSRQRVATQLSQMIRVVAQKPAIAAACARLFLQT